VIADAVRTDIELAATSSHECVTVDVSSPEHVALPAAEGTANQSRAQPDGFISRLPRAHCWCVSTSLLTPPAVSWMFSCFR